MTPSICILTGAGISAESGLQTFRDQDGLWQTRSIEDFATPHAFRRDPHAVHDFYNVRRRRLLDPEVQPNTAHVALARLESVWPAEVFVITQNIDDLHERAGSRNLVHMHGELLKVRCTSCNGIFPWREDAWPETRCSGCGDAGGLRPDVVWFGEIPYDVPTIENAIDECGIFIVIGTSATVYPAAGYLERFRYWGQGRAIELNLAPTTLSRKFDEVILGPATKTVPALVEQLLSLA